jgi:hypothetical protein
VAAPLCDHARQHGKEDDDGDRAQHENDQDDPGEDVDEAHDLRLSINPPSSPFSARHLGVSAAAPPMRAAATGR